MDQLLALLPYEFVQNAIAAGFVIAIVSGVVSGFVVARNMSFAVHALAELGFTGSAGFLLVHLSPVLGLLFGSAITAVFIGTLGVRARGRDVVVGVVMAFGLGLGVLFITLYKGYANQAFAILFGTITGVSRSDVFLLIAIGAVTLIALAAVYRPLVFATVDPEVAEARGVPVGALAVVFLLIMAAAVAVVSGTQSTRPMLAIRTARIDCVISSLFIETDSGWNPSETRTISGNAPPKYARARVFTRDPMWSRPTFSADR